MKDFYFLISQANRGAWGYYNRAPRHTQRHLESRALEVAPADFYEEVKDLSPYGSAMNRALFGLALYQVALECARIRQIVDLEDDLKYPKDTAQAETGAQSTV